MQNHMITTTKFKYPHDVYGKGKYIPIVKIKVKKSPDKPRQTLRFPAGSGPTFQDSRHMNW